MATYDPIEATFSTIRGEIAFELEDEIYGFLYSLFEIL
jgi:hypothetical protein